MRVKTSYLLILTGLLLCTITVQTTYAQKETGDDGTADAKPQELAEQSKRRESGEKLLSTFRDRARLSYARTSEAPKTLTGDLDKGGCMVFKEDLQGDHCRVYDTIYSVDKRKGGAALIVEDTAGGDGYAILKFEWATGGNDVTWHDTLSALKKANKDVSISDVEQAERRALGEALLGLFRDRARVAYAKTGVASKTLTGKLDKSGCGVVAKGSAGRLLQGLRHDLQRRQEERQCCTDRRGHGRGGRVRHPEVRIRYRR